MYIRNIKDIPNCIKMEAIVTEFLDLQPHKINSKINGDPVLRYIFLQTQFFRFLQLYYFTVIQFKDWPRNFVFR